MNLRLSSEQKRRHGRDLYPAVTVTAGFRLANVVRPGDVGRTAVDVHHAGGEIP